MIAANNGHLLAFDNLSGLPAWLSDALCRLASGGSFAVRQLYTDDEEVLFKAARPTLLNGIEDIVGRSDLADRAIFLTLGPIGEEQRRSETELWREFELARPAIFGALLDASAHGLRAVGSVPLGRLPRMAGLRALGHGLRNRALARRQLHSRLRSQPQGRDRGPHRRRPDRCLRAGVHERTQLVDGERRRSSAG